MALPRGDGGQEHGGPRGDGGQEHGGPRGDGGQGAGGRERQAPASEHGEAAAPQGAGRNSTCRAPSAARSWSRSSRNDHVVTRASAAR